MPILPISDGQGNLVPDPPDAPPTFEVWRRIWTLIHLPDETDPGKAAEIVAARTARNVGLDSGIKVSLELIERIVNDDQDFWHGAFSYFIMSVNLACSVHHPELVGYMRAGLVLGKSRSTIKRAWKRFAPVAHLQVAPSFHPHKGKQPARDWFLEMLAYAEEIRKIGESLYPHGRKAQDSPLLDPLTTWKCPADLILPRVRLQIEPLSDELLGRLRRVHQR